VRLTFSSNRHGPCHIFSQDADGGEPEKIVGGDHDLVPGSYSPDGEVLLFTEYNPESGACVWMCAPRSPAPPKRLMTTRGNHFSPAFAPDGGVFAYASDESGRLEVYVAPFPNARGRMQVSIDGGTEPVWSRDGRRLYYRSGSSIMAAPMASGNPPRFGEPQRIADGAYQPGAVTGLPNYDVAADGRLLLIAQSAEQAQPNRLSVTVNWFADLVARVHES
jgi:eukaryotic-like serine/threonine-protein kinase